MSGSVEASIRLGVMFGVLATMAVWEIVAPRRRLTVAKAPRWCSNLGLVVLNTIMARLAALIAGLMKTVLAAVTLGNVIRLKPEVDMTPAKKA